MNNNIEKTWINLLKIIQQQTGKTVRHFPQVRKLCLDCRSTNVEQLGELFYVCNDCEAEWKAWFCRSCGTYMDSRDPAVHVCKVCEHYHCECGQGSHSQCAELQSEMEVDKYVENDFEPDEDYEDYVEDVEVYGDTCDWCNSPYVTYQDEAFTLCESCREQLMGE